jgi:hypothetical protein
MQRYSTDSTLSNCMTKQKRTQVQTSLLGFGSAIFSDCQKYRYRLDRIWDVDLPPLAFGMLNPSTADHERNDPTIERCERRARTLGFGSLVVWNLFAYRATKPEILRKQSDPIGPENNFFIQEILIENKNREGKVVVGWGAHGQFLQRHVEVMEIGRGMNIPFYCLGVTNGGQPRHPLYISYERQLTFWS